MDAQEVSPIPAAEESINAVDNNTNKVEDSSNSLAKVSSAGESSSDAIDNNTDKVEEDSSNSPAKVSSAGESSSDAFDNDTDKVEDSSNSPAKVSSAGESSSDSFDNNIDKVEDSSNSLAKVSSAGESSSDTTDKVKESSNSPVKVSSAGESSSDAVDNNTDKIEEDSSNSQAKVLSVGESSSDAVDDDIDKVEEDTSKTPDKVLSAGKSSSDADDSNTDKVENSSNRPSQRVNNQQHTSTADDEKDRKAEINMLLIGETGSGKTSLVNLLKNYEKFQDNEIDPKEIEAFIFESDTCKLVTMGPLTTEIKSYDIMLAKEKTKWTVIDTPGLIDLSINAEKSIDKIISYLNEAGNINCICLVINGTNSRLTSYTKNCLEKVLTLLPMEMLQNIVVVFTKCTDMRRLNFETAVFKEFGLNIDPKHIAVFDNPYADFTNCKRKNIPIDPLDVTSEFKMTFEALRNLHDTIMPLVIPLGTNFGEFDRTKQAIENNLFKLHKASEQYLTLKCELQEKQNELDEAKLTNGRSVPESIFQEESETTSVICSDENCLMNCHVPCHCVEKCTNFKSDVCNDCGHDWKCHKKGKFRNNDEVVQKHKDWNKLSEEIDHTMKMLEELLKEFQSIRHKFAFTVVQTAVGNFKKQAMKLRLEIKHDIIKTLDDIE